MYGNPLIIDPGFYENYDGQYEVMPSLSSQVLPTSGKVMTRDLVIGPGACDPYDGNYNLSDIRGTDNSRGGEINDPGSGHWRE